MDKAAFSFESYSFNKVNIDFELNTVSDLQIEFYPSGVFRQTDSDSLFEMRVIFSAVDKCSGKEFIKIECNAIFRFSSRIEFDEIPLFFYGNSIAILFPYIRSFVSTLTLQANFPPLVLPTLNLLHLAEPLRKNTVKFKS